MNIFIYNYYAVREWCLLKIFLMLWSDGFCLLYFGEL